MLAFLYSFLDPSPIAPDLPTVPRHIPAHLHSLWRIVICACGLRKSLPDDAAPVLTRRAEACMPGPVARFPLQIDRRATHSPLLPADAEDVGAQIMSPCNHIAAPAARATLGACHQDALEAGL